MISFRRLAAAVASLLGCGCGTRAYHLEQLLDPYEFNGSSLTVYAVRESGEHQDRSPSFNPNGPNTRTTVAHAELHRIEFSVDGGSATFTGARRLLQLEGSPLASAITTAPGRLIQAPPPPRDDREVQLLAPLGNAFVVSAAGRYTVYADASRGRVLDSGPLPGLERLHSTWAGDRLYAVSTDEAGLVSRIRTTKVGSGGAWEELVHDARTLPLDSHPGQTYVEGCDRIGDEIVLLLRKSYPSGAGPGGALARYGLVRGSRLVATWTGDPPGFIRPDLRAVVSWHRSHGSLKAVLSLRSLEDGKERSLAVDAAPGLR